MYRKKICEISKLKGWITSQCLSVSVQACSTSIEFTCNLIRPLSVSHNTIHKILAVTEFEIKSEMLLVCGYELVLQPVMSSRLDDKKKKNMVCAIEK